MMIAAYGTAVPGGIFMPSIFLGACGGGALGLCFREALPESWDIQPGLYALIGATAMLGGVFRSSISLVVIMVEGTGGITFVFCIIVAVVVSNAVSSWLQKHGVYHMDLNRNEHVAYLSGKFILVILVFWLFWLFWLFWYRTCTGNWTDDVVFCAQGNRQGNSRCSPPGT
jgi:H+/Cl- antiporter ClcA